MLRNGRSSICKPCPNNFEIKENLSVDSFETNCFLSESESETFTRTNDDDTIGISIKDKEFIPIMDQTVSKDAQGPPPLYESSKELDDNNFPLLNTEQDKEIRPNVQLLKTGLQESTFALTHRIERFSVWKNLINTSGRLKIFAKTHHKDKTDDLSTS
ncbi:unnamed protein product [Mytilus coruscus]|uniref:Uncharacterized protein n=1 Tax=Mytilus coruscus TaxID=42192 RepID=A0A6J8C945_MYTCO|nr:unnamed protein product [Mytilus coruscus]